MTIPDEIERLAKLKDSGSISEAEFEKLKQIAFAAHERSGLILLPKLTRSAKIIAALLAGALGVFACLVVFAPSGPLDSQILADFEREISSSPSVRSFSITGKIAGTVQSGLTLSNIVVQVEFEPPDVAGKSLTGKVSTVKVNWNYMVTIQGQKESKTLPVNMNYLLTDRGWVLDSMSPPSRSVKF